MLNFDQLGYRNLDKLPTNLVNWVLTILLNLLNLGSICWIYIINNKKQSHIQLDSRKQVIAFQDRVITINIKEAQHPLK